MNTTSIFILKILRKLYTRNFGNKQLPPLQREENPDKASDMIYNLLTQSKPCMIARFGSTELSAIVNYLGILNPHHSICKYIKGEQTEWWWNKNIMKQMQEWSGFFPPTEEMLSRFCEMMMEDAKEVDILGSWLKQEWYMPLEHTSKVALLLLEPFWSPTPWTRCLQDKKVLVIHPFAETIQQQYAIREYLFDNKEILPSFELKTLKAVQSLGGNSSFNDWFEALNWMKKEMDNIDYDICLLGCGAYGFPLAAYAKRKGKKAVHLGGSLQLLFGIKGKRWEIPEYGERFFRKKGLYLQLINEYWRRPNEHETYKNASSIEGGCYW